MFGACVDFGGVISRTVFETHDDNERALGLAPGTLNWRGPFDPDGDALWRSMQAGEISERDYWYHRARETGALVGEEWTDLPSFLQRIRGAEPDRIIRPQARVAIARASEAGRKLAILSNELDLFYGPDFRERLPLLHEFDVIIDATYTGIMKPDSRAYQMVTDALQLPPDQCVFVDDQRRNVAGALDFGMKAVQFDVAHPRKGFNAALALLGLAELSGDDQ
ncbi:MAG: HAD-IA family hydrolase [Ahrensia sp.]|nr:HAD-IA family hydrolase [Ahrensia sp.]